MQEPQGSDGRPSRRERGIQRRRQVKTELADLQGGVASLRQLTALGLTYDEIRAEVSAGRWHRVGRRTISLRGPEPTCEEARWRRALWDVGGGACLDGATALLAAGLQRWSEPTVHVSVPARSRYHQTAGVRVHVLRDRGEVIGAGTQAIGPGMPRTRPEVAALRAAMWAKSDRAAATVLSMAVQQRLVDPDRLLRAWTGTTRCPRHTVLGQLVPLIGAGAQALSEIDFAELARARGWPEPDRQAVVHTPGGRIYLDVRFSAFGVVAEINGVQHYEGLAIVGDAIRRNRHAIGDVTALEIPAIGLVLEPEPLLDQVEDALRRGGWDGGARLKAG